MKDIRYPTQMYTPQPRAPVFGNLELVTLILASIHSIYSVYCLLLDLSSIAFLLASGQYLLAILFLIIGSLKHLCQFLWFAQLFGFNPFASNPIITTAITGGGMVVLGISLGAYIMMIYNATHSMIEVMTHPHVIEFTTFVIADGFMLLVLLKTKTFYEEYFHYSPIPPRQVQLQVQPQEVEMEKLVMPPKQMQAFHGYSYAPYF